MCIKIRPHSSPCPVLVQQVGSRLSDNVIGAITGGVVGFILLLVACLFLLYRKLRTDSAPIYMKEAVNDGAHDPHVDADLIPNFVGASPSLI